MSDATPTPDSEALIDLIEGWLNTKTWEESRTFLKEHHAQLLSDEVVTLFEERLADLAEADGEHHEHEHHTGDEHEEEDSEEEHKHIIQILQQHMIIMEIARTQSIDTAYEELLKLSHFALALEKLPDETKTAIEGLMAANDPEELIALIMQNPLLFTDEFFTTVETLLEELQEAGEERAFEGLLERYEVLLQLAEASENDDDDDDDN